MSQESETLVDLQASNLVPLGFVLTRNDNDENVYEVSLLVKTIESLPTPATFKVMLRVWDRAAQRAMTMDFHVLRPAAQTEIGRAQLGEPTSDERIFLRKLGLLDPVEDGD